MTLRHAAAAQPAAPDEDSRAGRRPGPDGEPLLTLERFLPYRLNVVASVVSNALARIYADRFQLTIPQWRVMATLGQYGTRTARDIALHGVMHKSTVSRAVSALEGRGLLSRRPNAQDMREEHLLLTPEGRTIYEAVVPEALTFEERVTSALDPQERAVLFGLIERLDRQTRRLAPDLDEEPPA